MTWGYFAYFAGLVPVWGFVFVRLRDARTRRLRAWAIASVCSILWPVWLVTYEHSKEKTAKRRREEHATALKKREDEERWLASIEEDLRQIDS